MSTTTIKESKTSESTKVAQLFGEMNSFNSCLKLVHWDVTGKGSYAMHIALDQAVHTLRDATDRLVETTYANLGDLHIVIPETKKPKDPIAYCEGFYDHVENMRGLFKDSFSQSILDDYQEGIKQLLYRLKRLQ